MLRWSAFSCQSRCFTAARDAVSPVIGVIMMVAITVVLAATVFVMVNGLGPKGGSDPPEIVFDMSEAQDRATVRTADNDAQWDQLQIRLSVAGAWVLNGDITDSASHTAAAAGEWQTVGGGSRIGGGDYIEVCGDVAGPMDVDIRYQDLNQIVSRFSLVNVAECVP